MKTRAAKISCSISIFFLLFVASPCLSVEIDGPMGPLADQDIGDTGATGTAALTNGVFSISGSGADIWGSSDAFHYVYQNWSGDGAIVIRVLHIDETDTYARAGIMFRASLDPGSAHAFAFYRAGGETGFEARLDSFDSTWIDATWANEPYWVKLVRLQNTFIAYDSPDGTNWNEIGTTNIDMPTNILVGLAVTSHDYGALCTATLDDLQMASRPTAPSNVKALRAFDHIEVSWTDNSTNEQGFMIETSWDGVNFFTNWLSSVGPNRTNFIYDDVRSVAFRVRATGLISSCYSDVALPKENVLDPIPATWRSADIGNPALSGSGNFQAGTMRVGGSGTDIGGVADQFHFVYQQLTGDGEIMAFFPYSEMNAAGSQGDGLTKSGLMIRQSLAPGAANAFVFLTSNGAGWQARASEGADTLYEPTSQWRYPGIWLRLTRIGDSFTAYIAGQAFDWIEIGSQQIPMNNSIYVGLAVDSHTTTNNYLHLTDFANASVTAAGGNLAVLPQTYGICSLLLNGMCGHTYEIEASLDLRNWSLIATQVTSNGTASFTNNDLAIYPKRFYRPVLVR